jgi:dolichyl-phosphate-mannose--protein O-mannosyl transferase
LLAGRIFALPIAACLQGTNKLKILQSSTVPVTLLLLLMALLAGGAAWRESVTVDEVAHTGAGVSYLQKLDMRMNGEHPPLAKVLAAIPLVLRKARADYSDTSELIEKSPRSREKNERVASFCHPSGDSYFGGG